MIQGRRYTLPFQNVTLNTGGPQDLFGIYTGTTKIIAITSVNLGQVTGTAVANYRIRLRRLLAAVTSGSGGSSGTSAIKPFLPGDAAATVTARLNDTTQAASSTIIDLWDDQWNTINGYLWVPPTPSSPFVIGLSEAFVVSLDTTPTALVTNGTVTFEELP